MHETDIHIFTPSELYIECDGLTDGQILLNIFIYVVLIKDKLWTSRHLLREFDENNFKFQPAGLNFEWLEYEVSFSDKFDT